MSAQTPALQQTTQFGLYTHGYTGTGFYIFLPPLIQEGLLQSVIETLLWWLGGKSGSIGKKEFCPSLLWDNVSKDSGKKIPILPNYFLDGVHWANLQSVQILHCAAFCQKAAHRWSFPPFSLTPTGVHWGDGTAGCLLPGLAWGVGAEKDKGKLALVCFLLLALAKRQQSSSLPPPHPSSCSMLASGEDGGKMVSMLPLSH